MAAKTRLANTTHRALGKAVSYTVKQWDRCENDCFLEHLKARSFRRVPSCLREETMFAPWRTGATIDGDLFFALRSKQSRYSLQGTPLVPCRLSDGCPLFPAHFKNFGVTDIAACFYLVDLHEFIGHFSEAIYLFFHFYHAVIHG